jgi:hypothetical protein
LPVTVTLYVPLMAVVAFGRVGFWRLELNGTLAPQLYVAPAPAPVTDRRMLLPTHRGLLLLSCGLISWLIVTCVVATCVQPLAVLTVTLYTPLMAAVALGRLGFWALELKLGPLHVQAVPPFTPKLSWLPAHTGALLLAVRRGLGVTVMDFSVLAVQVPSPIVRDIE